jgi:hypothetical protein
MVKDMPDDPELCERAERGDSEAALDLGWKCAQKLRSPNDDEEAVLWFRRTSTPQGKNNLGWMYQNGLGVAQDDREALRFYKESADGGCASAYTNIGWMRMHGRGCVRDENAALGSFRRAAGMGCPAAFLWLEHLNAGTRPESVEPSSPLCSAFDTKPFAAAYGEGRDSLEILVALNLCRASISRIAASADRLVLEEEYRGILDNIDPAVMRGDDDLIGLFEKLLSQIGADLFRAEEADYIRKAAERGMAERLSDTLNSSASTIEQISQAALSSGNAAAAAASLLFSLFGAYVKYRSLPERYRREADERVRRLDGEGTSRYQALQRQFFSACSKLVSRYRLDSRSLLSEEQIRKFADILAEEDTPKALRLCTYHSREFSAYPPFWLRMGILARDAGDPKTALACFETVVERSGGVLRKDPFLATALLAGIDLLPEEAREEKLSRLRKAREHFRDEDWMQRLVAGVLAYSMNDVVFADHCMQYNIDCGHYVDLHRRVIEERGLTVAVVHELGTAFSQMASSPLALNVFALDPNTAAEPEKTLAEGTITVPQSDDERKRGLFGFLLGRKRGEMP